MWRRGIRFRKLPLSLSLLLLALAPLAVAAPRPDKGSWENLKELQHNQQVQVVLNDAKSYRGEFQSVNNEGIVVRVTAGVEKFARKDVRRISVRGKRHTRRNILIGTLVGFGLGVAAGAAICSTDTCSGGAPLLLGAGTGAPLGALAGYVMPTGGWHVVYRAP